MKFYAKILLIFLVLSSYSLLKSDDAYPYWEMCIRNESGENIYVKLYPISAVFEEGLNKNN